MNFLTVISDVVNYIFCNKKDCIVNKKELTNHERYVAGKELCRLMNTEPAYIFDSGLMVSEHEFHIDTLKMERFLKHRCHTVKKCESLDEVVDRIYGERVKELVLNLI